MSQTAYKNDLPEAKKILERIELDLMYLLSDAHSLRDEKFSSIVDKLEMASICIALAVKSLHEEYMN